MIFYQRSAAWNQKRRAYPQVENFIKPLRERRGAADAKGLFRRRVVFDDVEILVDNDRDIRRSVRTIIGKGFRALTHERHAHRQLRLA